MLALVIDCHTRVLLVWQAVNALRRLVGELGQTSSACTGQAGQEDGADHLGPDA
jgi:hypothetical protein